MSSDESTVRVSISESTDDCSEIDEVLEKCVKTKKSAKPGIIYLSAVPPGFNVRKIQDYFSQFGDVGRCFLQPDKKKHKGKRKPKNLTFTEGWIEFKKRKYAKQVAETLNNEPVGGKKKKLHYDFLWNIKYLPGFQWVHLNERLAYERISKQHKLRAEIAAAKRESAFFVKSVNLSKSLKRKGVDFTKTQDEVSLGCNNDTFTTEIPSTSVNQSAVENSSQDTGKRKLSSSTTDRVKFFKSIFGS